MRKAVCHGKKINKKKKSVDFFCKSMDWFTCDRDLRHRRINQI